MTKITIIPALFMLGTLLAVAAQNALCFFILCLICWHLNQSPQFNLAKLNTMRTEFKYYFIAGGCFLTWMILSGFLNQANPDFKPAKFIGGYLAIFLFPPLFWLLRPYTEKISYRALRRLVCGLSIILLCMVLSQSIWGWRLLDGQFVADITRPRGLFSHPLTLAYVGLILLGAGTVVVHLFGKNLWAWTFLLSGIATCMLTQSRVVQLFAVLGLGTAIFLLTRGKMRFSILATGLLLCIGVMATENQVSERFRSMFQRESFDRQSDYPDDRLAFWHVHLEMWKERPLLGHGPHIHTKYRTPYYEKLGLRDLKKKYEAHNTYLQLSVSGGLVGLALFLVFSFFQWRIALAGLKGNMRVLTMVGLASFALASLTQNSIQDSEVRYCYTMILCMLILLPDRANQKATSEST